MVPEPRPAAGRRSRGGCDPAGTFVVAVDSAAGRAQATVPLAVDERRAGVALVLAPKRVVTGRFVDLATGAPLAGVRARVTGADGRFTVPDAPDGLVYVVGLKTEPGARWPLVRWLVELPAGAAADVGDVPMVAGLARGGTVALTAIADD